MRPALALLMALGCQQHPENGFAVDVTILAASEVTDGDLAAIRTLEVYVTGDAGQEYTQRIAVNAPSQPRFSREPAGWIYRPRPGTSAETVTFEVYAWAADECGIAYGQASAAVEPGATTETTVHLAPGVGPSRDMGVDQSPDCGALPAGTSDFYVDATAGPGGTGSASCPFARITDALAVAQASSEPSRTVHVAAGLYDREALPFVVRGPITIEGAGSTVTTVLGTGSFDRISIGGVFNRNYETALIVGHDLYPQTVRGIAFDSGATDFTYTRFGIICDRGNAFAYADAAATPANAVFEDIALRAWDSGLSIGTSDNPTPSGCSAQITRSTVTGNGVGVWVAGCGDGTNTKLAATAQIGDGTAAGANVFRRNRNPTSTGYGENGTAQAVVVFNCSPSVRILNNTFDDNDEGITLIGSVNDRDLIVRDNTFTAHSVVGISIHLDGTLADFSGNSFIGNTAPINPGFVGCNGRALACGVWFIGNASVGAGAAHARNNRFIGNDIGLYVTGTPFSGTRLLDFGNAGDLGGNVFSCNSAPSGSTEIGGDVWFQVSAGSTQPVSFAGNQWDQLSVTPSASAQNGMDLYAVGGVAVDTSSASLSAPACPSGRIR